jgi:hypothetical protein
MNIKKYKVSLSQWNVLRNPLARISSALNKETLPSHVAPKKK